MEAAGVFTAVVATAELRAGFLTTHMVEDRELIVAAPREGGFTSRRDLPALGLPARLRTAAEKAAWSSARCTARASTPSPARS